VGLLNAEETSAVNKRTKDRKSISVSFLLKERTDSSCSCDSFMPGQCPIPHFCNQPSVRCEVVKLCLIAYLYSAYSLWMLERFYALPFLPQKCALILGAEVAQLVCRPATGWVAEELGFIPSHGQGTFLHIVKIGFDSLPRGTCTTPEGGGVYAKTSRSMQN
jgi:hypothetical protein